MIYKFVFQVLNKVPDNDADPMQVIGEIEVETTRPETMFGDTAVAVHPEDPRYKVCELQQYNDGPILHHEKSY